MVVKVEKKEPERNINEKYFDALRTLQLKIPFHPNPSALYPNPWLLRGESSSNRLLSNMSFQPQSGEWGRFGVFMGDCLLPVVFPSSGVVYVFDTNRFSGVGWINTRSPEYLELIKNLATTHDLNLSKVGDWVQAEQMLSQKYYLYDPKTGIVTSPKAIELTTVSHILITKDQAEKINRKSIPKHLASKLHIVK